MSIIDVIIDLARPVQVPTFEYDQMLNGLTEDLKKWVLIALITTSIWILIFAVYFIKTKKGKKVTYTIKKDVKDEEGLYNLDTIDNYTDTRKKWELENREIQINYKIKQIDPDFSVRKFKIDVFF